MFLLGELPSWLSVDFARSAAGLLAVAAAVLIVAAFFTIRSITVRAVIVCLLAVSVFGLLHYRAELNDCGRNGCSCKLFGQDLQGDNCNRA